MDRMEQYAQNELRLLTVREMIRSICVWASHRSGHWQRYIYTCPLKLVIDRQRPDDDLFYFYNERMAVYRDMYGGGAPSPDMAAPIHEHFYEQMELVPKMKQVLNFYDM